MILELCKGVHYVDLGESFQTHIYLQNFVLIQPRTSHISFRCSRDDCYFEVLQRYGLIAAALEEGTQRIKFWCCTAHRDAVWGVGLAIYAAANGVSALAHLSCKILQIFGGLVLGCIKTEFCKKIPV